MKYKVGDEVIIKEDHWDGKFKKGQIVTINESETYSFEDVYWVIAPGVEPSSRIYGGWKQYEENLAPVTKLAKVLK